MLVAVKNHDDSASKVTANGLEERGSNPGRSRLNFSSPPLPEDLWYPPSLILRDRTEEGH